MNPFSELCTRWKRLIAMHFHIQRSKMKNSKLWTFIKMDKARIFIDLNEMVTENIILLSKDDTKIDSQGNQIVFYESMLKNLNKLRAECDSETENILLDLMDFIHL